MTKYAVCMGRTAWDNAYSRIVQAAPDFGEHDAVLKAEGTGNGKSSVVWFTSSLPMISELLTILHQDACFSTSMYNMLKPRAARMARDSILSQLAEQGIDRKAHVTNLDFVDIINGESEGEN